MTLLTERFAMEFAAGLVIGIVGAFFSFLALREQRKETDKRLHYVRFASPFLTIGDEATREAVELYVHDRPLINPHVYVVVIENTGRAPIVPEDFDSPIMVRLDKSVFAAAQLSWNRPEILREEHEIEMSSRELQVGPMLLNPRDALTLIALVETAQDDLSVVARLAGVEQVVQIPASNWVSLEVVNENYLNRHNRGGKLSRRSRTRLMKRAVNCIRIRWPLFTNPNGEAEFLLHQVEVRINGVTTRHPTMFIYGMTNDTGRRLLPSDFGGPITIRSAQSVFRHASITRRPGQEGEEELPITMRDHELVIDPPPELDRRGTLYLGIILDGPGDDLEISSPLVPISVLLALSPGEGSPMKVRLEKASRRLVRRLRGLLSRH